MYLKSLALVSVFAITAQSATAQEVGDLSVGVGISNFGASLEVQYGIAPNTAVRGMLMGGINIEDEFEFEDEIVDGKAELGGLAILADYYPLANPWRVSGGLFFSNTSISGESNGDTVTVEFEQDIIPMITTGFDYEFTPGWSVTGDIGVLVSSLEASSTDQITEDDLNEALEDIPVFPIAALAVTYSY